MDQALPDDPGPDHVRGALIGGLVAGLLTGLLTPCCFLWAPLAGLIGAKVAARRTAWFGPQDGAVAGGCAGAVAWLLQALLNVPAALLVPTLARRNPQLVNAVPPPMREALTQAPSVADLLVVHGALLLALLAAGAAVGALAGQTFLRKEPAA
ncbi:MAG: hypothetical protein M9894_19100 [Planctomycetes bacterium]|nr:hypothetical protein [Planctomycetota bacterium]